jgi:hypothetical protein
MSASYLKSFEQRAPRKTAQASKNEVLPTTTKGACGRSAVAGHQAQRRKSRARFARLANHECGLSAYRRADGVIPGFRNRWPAEPPPAFCVIPKAKKWIDS